MTASCLSGLYSPSPSFVLSKVHSDLFLRVLDSSPNILICFLERLRRGMSFEILLSWIPILVLPFTTYVIFEKIALSLVLCFLTVSGGKKLKESCVF